MHAATGPDSKKLHTVAEIAGAIGVSAGAADRPAPACTSPAPEVYAGGRCRRATSRRDITFLASALHRQGRTLAIDADPQGSLTAWSAGGELPFTVVSMPTPQIHRQIKDLAADYEHVVIDTPPGEMSITRSAILAVPLVLVPLSPTGLLALVTTLLAPTGSRATQEELRARFKSIPDTGLISGTPEACVERIREYQDAGIDHFLFTIPDVADSAYLHVVGEQILPHLKPARHTQPA